MIKAKGQRSNMRFLQYLKNKKRYKGHLYYRHIGNHIMGFHYIPWPVFCYVFFLNISKTIRDKDLICIVDIWKFIYRLLFYAMTVYWVESLEVKYVFVLGGGCTLLSALFSIRSGMLILSGLEIFTYSTHFKNILQHIILF